MMKNNVLTNENKNYQYFTQNKIGFFSSVTFPQGEHKQYPPVQLNGVTHNVLFAIHDSLNALTNHKIFDIIKKIFIPININRLNMNNWMMYDIEYDDRLEE